MDAEDDSDWSPLTIASSAGHTDCVNLLLSHGANSKSTTANGQTPLHYAASRARIPIITLLLNAGAPVSVQDSLGSTPLHRAASQGHTEAVRLLLDGRADPSYLGLTLELLRSAIV